MKKLVQVVIATAIAAGSLLFASAAAWASPCAGGERLVGKTGAAWLCQNIDTGVIREVAF